MRRIDDIWSGCPEGEISRMVGVIRHSRQRQLLANLLIITAMIVAAWTIRAVAALAL